MQLQSMFLFTRREQLQEALENNLNIDFAIDELLPMLMKTILGQVTKML